MALLGRGAAGVETRSRRRRSGEEVFEGNDLKHWIHELKNQRQIQQSNVRAMQKAVAVSQQPGSINYNQTPPDVAEAARYKGRFDAIMKQEAELARINQDMHSAQREERSKNEKAIKDSRIANFDAWFEANGRPKRTPSKMEKFLSFVPETKALVAGANSKDMTVQFKSTPSGARSLRKGILIQ